MILASLALAAQQIVVPGPNGPELHDLPPRAETVAAVRAERSAPAEPRCLKPARIFNYAAHALDVASTVAAIDRGAVEVGPLARPILGKHPRTHELIAFKLVPLFGLRLFDEHLVRSGRGRAACTVNFSFGAPALVAAGLNARFVF